MNRDEIAVSLLPTLLEGARLGPLTDAERLKQFDLVAKVAYEIADAMIKESKETPNV